MARYENLPVYKKAMDLAVYIENIMRGFSRHHKYTIGSDMRNVSRNIVSLIIKANSRREKSGALTDLRDLCKEMKVLTEKLTYLYI